MAAKVNATTNIVNPEDGALVTLLAGDEVPEWADGMVGDHLLDAPKAEAKAAPAAKATK